MGRTMEKLKSTSKLSEWVEAINELIDKSNDSQLVLNSFKESSFIDYDERTTIITSAQINASYIHEIKITGLYELWNDGDQDVYLYVQHGNYFAHTLPAGETINIPINAGSQLEFTSHDFPDGALVRVFLQKTVIEMVNEYTEEQLQIFNELEQVKLEMATINQKFEELNTLQSEYNAGIRLLDQVNINISSLSNRLTALENK